MSKRSIFFSYLVTIALSIFLIQCSDLTFKGDKQANQNSSNEGELNRAEKSNDDLKDININNSKTSIKVKDKTIEVQTSPDPEPSTEPSTEVEKVDTILTLNTSSNPVIGKKVSINGTLKDTNNHPIKGATINLKINREVQPSCTTNDSGKFEYLYEVAESGSHNIKVSYAGDDTHNSVEKTKTFNALKINSSLSILTSLTNIHKGDSLTIKGNLLAEDTTPIQSASVVVDVNGDKMSVTTNSLGEYSIPFNPTAVGDYHLEVSYEGNNRYADSLTTADFTVSREPVPEKITTSMSLNSISGATVGKSVTIKGTLKDTNQNPISGATIKLTVGGVVQASMITNASGVFSSSYIVKRAGSHCVAVTFDETATHKGSTANKNFTAKINTELEIKIDKPADNRDSFFLGERISIHGSLFKVIDDASGTGASNAEIKIKINSTSFTVTTNNDGHFNYNYVPTAIGTYNVTVSYAGDSQYNPSTDISMTVEIVEITKIFPNLTVQTHSISSGENATVNVFLPSNATGSVDIDVTDEGRHPGLRSVGGKITLVLTQPTDGKHIITVTFNGDTKYKSTSVFLYLDVNSDEKADPTISIDPIGTVKLGQEIMITGQLKIGSIPLAGVEVKLGMHQPLVESTTTDAQGRFSFKYTPKYLGKQCAFVGFFGNETTNPTKSYDESMNFLVEE